MPHQSRVKWITDQTLDRWIMRRKAVCAARLPFRDSRCSQHRKSNSIVKAPPGLGPKMCWMQCHVLNDLEGSDFESCTSRTTLPALLLLKGVFQIVFNPSGRALQLTFLLMRGYVVPRISTTRLTLTKAHRAYAPLTTLFLHQHVRGICPRMDWWRRCPGRCSIQQALRARPRCGIFHTRVAPPVTDDRIYTVSIPRLLL